MTGWAPPTGPNPPGEPPLVGWATPTDEGLGIGAAIRAGWDLARDHLAGLAAVAAIPILIWNILLIPVWLGFADVAERMARFMTTLDLTRYRTDPRALDREFQAMLTLPTELVVGSSVLGGLGFVIAIVGVAAITSATLDAAAGRPVSIGRSFAAVTSHASAIVVPAIVLGVVLGIGSLGLNLNQAGMVAAGRQPGQAAVTSLLTIVGLVLYVALIVLAIRWSLALQAILAEDLGIRASLARSAALTAGVRVRIGLTIVVVGVATSLLLSVPALVVSAALGLATGSITVAVLASFVIITIGSLVIFPIVVAVLTVIYRDRVASRPALPGP